MRKLISGIVEFRSKQTAEQKLKFAHLALGQRPDTLFVCCSDSRVAPNVFASTDPGDMFVVRNVGNLIPPADAHGRSVSDRSEAGAIEFALASLKIRDIVICGHSECGAMNALLAGADTIEWPNLKSWIATAQPVLASWRGGEEIDPGLSPLNRLSQLNVLQQAANIMTYQMVRDLVDRGELAVHGWWFDIARGEVLGYDPRSRRFSPIDSWAATVALSGPRGGPSREA